MELKHLRKAEQQQQQQVQQEQPLLPVEKQLLRQYATINESKIPVVSGGGGGAGSSATIPPTRGSAARTSHHHMTLRGDLGSDTSVPMPEKRLRLLPKRNRARWPRLGITGTYRLYPQSVFLVVVLVGRRPLQPPLT